MNKRYRVIFNEATQTYTAVSEEAPAKGKKASKATKALVATAVGLGATTITYASWVSATNGGSSINNSAVGVPSAQGLQTAATSGKDGIALSTSNIIADYALAGKESIAIGKQADAAFNEYDPNSGNAFAIGHYSQADANSIAIGNLAEAVGTNAFALGHGASATSNNIALGNNSQAVDLTANQLSGKGVVLNNKSYDFAAANEVNSFSIGSVGNERVMTNVGAGQVNATSTHAVNGSQLYAAYGAINDLSDKTWSVQVNGNPAAAVASDDTVAFLDGKNIKVTQDPNNPLNITVATANDVAFNSMTVGPVTINSNGINAGNRKIINVAPGILSNTSTDAINGSQLYATNTNVTNNHNDIRALEDQTWKIQVNGGTATAVAADEIVSFNDGKNISIVQNAQNPNSLTISTKDDVTFKSVIVHDGPLPASGNDVITITSKGIGAGNKKVTNVADGIIAKNSKDAINGGQLYNAIGASSSWTLISEDANGNAVETKISSIAPLAIKDDGKTTQVVLSKDADGKDTLVVSAANPLQYVDGKGDAAADQFNPTDNIVALVDKDGTTDAPVTLTNVKDGAVSSDSKDAINGSQLYDAGNSIGDIIGGGASFVGDTIVWNDNNPAGGSYNGIGGTGKDNIHDAIQHLNKKSEEVSAGWLYTVDGDKTTQGQVSANENFDFAAATTTVEGQDFKNITITQSTDGDGIKVGLANNIGVDSITVGESKITSTGGNLQVGQGTISSGRTGSIGLGNGYTIGADNSVALGNNSVADTVIGTKDVTIRGDKYAFAGAKPVGTVSVGAKDAERTITNVAAGQITATSTDAINGSQLYATNTALEKISNGGAGVVQYADPTTPTKPNGGTPTNTATLVGKDAAPVTLTNVAPGKNGTDAVNVSQLNQVKQDLGDVSDRANAGTASAMATALLPQAYDAGSSMVGVGAADFDGEQGYAIGYSSVSEGGKWVVRAAGTGNSQEKFGVGASVGYRWG